jgi:hypothetical protein
MYGSYRRRQVRVSCHRACGFEIGTRRVTVRPSPVIFDSVVSASRITQSLNNNLRCAQQCPEPDERPRPRFPRLERAGCYKRLPPIQALVIADVNGHMVDSP